MEQFRFRPIGCDGRAHREIIITLVTPDWAEIDHPSAAPSRIDPLSNMIWCGRPRARANGYNRCPGHRLPSPFALIERLRQGEQIVLS
jgi:hypothetical protein